ncbi:site-specific integrase [Paracholeplasma manati]|uniref:Site-specific integrase n=1 Tax=Paracholeplasma manati TaxID=591373 RepID=A0ABT2Y629_9MOLU|nr:site-specific integrase [Paracholeplasma manati]MCV2231932.1 site-specific integrase [Paracholeplasma manati]MDG0888915.1 site-specific integrase [Paracholeplasma manati]
MAVCKRGDKYSYRVYVYDHERGKNRQIEKRGFTTRKAARQAEVEFLSKYELTNSLKKHELSFKTVYDFYLYQKKKEWKATTYYGIKKILDKWLLEPFKNLDFTKITKSHINKWRNELDNHGFSSRYKNKLLTNLKSMFSLAMDEFDIQHNVVKSEPSFRDDKLSVESGIYTEDEFKMFQSVINDNQYKLLFTMLFYTGLRIGEIRALKWNDIDTDKGSIVINKQISNKTFDRKPILVQPKTKSSNREVFYPKKEINPLLELNVSVLSDFYGNNKSLFVFGYKKPLSETTIRRKNEHYSKAACLHTIRIHDFRHSYITMLFYKNVDPLTTKDQVGHSSVKTTLDIYTKLEKDTRKNRINSAFDDE